MATPSKNQTPADQARIERSRLITEQVKAIPLGDVLESLGYAGEKSGARHLKYRINGGLLLNVEKDGAVFGALGGVKFRCLDNKGGGAGAVDLLMALREATGQPIEFPEAKEWLQRQFLPHTIELRHGGARRQVAYGDIDLAAMLHRGAVLRQEGPKDVEHLRILEGWHGRDADAHAVAVKCDAQGTVASIDAGKEFKYSPRPPTYLRPSDEPVLTLVTGENPLIPEGTKSTDANLLLVPFGPFSGLMLGQLSPEQKEVLRAEAKAKRFQEAIASSSVWSRPSTKPKTARQPGQEVEITLPQRLDVIELNGKKCDNLQIARDYLVKKRRLPSKMVDAALRQNSCFPTESVIYKKGPDGQPTSEVLFRHPALCIPICGTSSDKPIAYQLKVLYQDPELAKRYKGRDSYNFGPVTQGFARIGDFDKGTKHVVFTEAYIDGLSKWELSRREIVTSKLGAEPEQYDEWIARVRAEKGRNYRWRDAVEGFCRDKDLPLERVPHFMSAYGAHSKTCFLATTGSRFPEEFLQLCKERGISVTTALDNDWAGRSMAKKYAERCAELGVPYRDIVPANGEMMLALKEDAKGKERAKRTESHLREHNTMFKVLPTERGWIKIKIENTAASAEWVDKLRDEDRVDRQEVRQRTGQDEVQRSVEIEYYNKDWNDIIKGGYERTFTSDFRSAWLSNREIEKSAQSVKPTGASDPLEAAYRAGATTPPTPRVPANGGPEIG